MNPSPKAPWDIFCRVIDNHGDLGVCLRLCRDLVQRGVPVRLWVDDASALGWMWPDAMRHPDLMVLPWPQTEVRLSPAPAVVIEAFGCELPEHCLAQMAAMNPPPRWVNLEYLSAESYVERSHGLRSPQFSGPAKGLEKHFFYPGFTSRTGGLLREPGLLAAQQAFDRTAWLMAQGIDLKPDERLVSVFSYPNAPMQALLRALAQRPTLLLLCPGWAQQQTPGLLAARQSQGEAATLRLHALPYLSQPDYDRLLWACDINLVRGEDSFVRAQWAGKPMLWHIYPQDDGVHAEKLAAFLDRKQAATAQLALPAEHRIERQAWQAWNGLQQGSYTTCEQALKDWIAALESSSAPTAAAQAWREHLLAQEDLCTQLLRFVGEQPAESG